MSRRVSGRGERKYHRRLQHWRTGEQHRITMEASPDGWHPWRCSCGAAGAELSASIRGVVVGEHLLRAKSALRRHR